MLKQYKPETLLLSLFAATCLTAYCSGRLAFFLIIPPQLLPGLAALIATFWYLGRRFKELASWYTIVRRISVVSLCFGIGFLPVAFGDSYFVIGRRHHIANLFTQELIDEIRQTLPKKIPEGNDGFFFKLTAEDLPAAVGKTGWGFPGHIRCTIDPKTREPAITLTWGGALIAHHGIVITKDLIPPEGYPWHSTNEKGETVGHYDHRFYPFLSGAYIFTDEN